MQSVRGDAERSSDVCGQRTLPIRIDMAVELPIDCMQQSAVDSTINIVTTSINLFRNAPAYVELFCYLIVYESRL